MVDFTALIKCGVQFVHVGKKREISFAKKKRGIFFSLLTHEGSHGQRSIGIPTQL